MKDLGTLLGAFVSLGLLAACGDADEVGLAPDEQPAAPESPGVLTCDALVAGVLDATGDEVTGELGGAGRSAATGCSGDMGAFGPEAVYQLDLTDESGVWIEVEGDAGLSVAWRRCRRRRPPRRTRRSRGCRPHSDCRGRRGRICG